MPNRRASFSDSLRATSHLSSETYRLLWLVEVSSMITGRIGASVSVSMERPSSALRGGAVGRSRPLLPGKIIIFSTSSAISTERGLTLRYGNIFHAMTTNRGWEVIWTPLSSFRLREDRISGKWLSHYKLWCEAHKWLRKFSIQSHESSDY